MMLTHFACTLITAPCVPPTLQESPAPAITPKSLPAEDCQEKGGMTSQCRTLGPALAWTYLSCDRGAFALTELSSAPSSLPTCGHNLRTHLQRKRAQEACREKCSAPFHVQGGAIPTGWHILCKVCPSWWGNAGDKTFWNELCLQTSYLPLGKRVFPNPPQLQQQQS